MRRVNSNSALRIAALALICLGSGAMQAQNYEDVLRYSRIDPLGSGRSIGMGGAMTGLGADLGCLWSNPAGLGMYRQSDFSLSLGLSGSGASTTSADLSEVNARAGVIVPQFGLALTYPLTSLDFQQATIAVGYTKIANLQRYGQWDGGESSGSMTQEFAAAAQGTGWESLYDMDPFYVEPAWNTYLIDLVDADVDGQYMSAYEAGGPVNHELTLDQRGQIGETTIAVGSTYRERLQLGLSIGFTSIDMTREELYKESGFGPASDLEDWSIKDELEVTGNGTHWGAGLIYSLGTLRIGASYRSGERLKIDDVYEVTVHSMFTSVPSRYSAKSPVSSIRYVVRTPRRYRLGLAWTLGKSAVLTADFEEVNYASARFSTSDFSASDVDQINAEVSSILQAATILRTGLEIRANEEWRVRAGAGYESAPSLGPLDEGHRIWGALGLGYRKDNYYLSTTYRHRVSSEDGMTYASAPYSTTARWGTGMLAVTGGVRF